MTPSAQAPPETTAQLLTLVRNGDVAAKERLLGRYLPILSRWARGRLPGTARDLAETDDLVQVTLIRALDRLDAFESRREGAFLAYLRTILMNALRDEIRRSSRRGIGVSLDEAALADPTARTPGTREAIRVYETMLSELPDTQQEAVIMRLEFGFTYTEIAAAIGSASPDAARMIVKRGLARIAQAMPERDA